MSRIYEAWRDVMDNKSDPRTKDMFMMSSPLPTMALSLSYIFAVKVIGPKLMANRKAFDAKRIQLWYNILHLAFQLYMFYEAISLGWLTGSFNFRCQPVDFAMTGIPARIARNCWLYYISKFTDYFETFIFIMLKRFDMVNLYHIAHHSVMPVSVWWGVKFIAGGHSAFFGFLNTFVHIVIYSYLVLITTLPQTRKYFGWWKTFYPFFQIAQFALIFLHAFQLVWKNDCNYPIAFVYFIGAHAVLFYILVKNKMRMDKKAKMLRKAKEDLNENESDFSKQGNTELYEAVEQVTNGYTSTRHRVYVGATR